MSGVETEIGSSALRLWVAAGSLASLVALFVVAFAMPWTRTVAALRAALIVLSAVLGAAAAVAFVGRPAGDQGAERQALKMRAAELAAQALAPGSPLACLDAIAGDAVESACEKALFASPTTVATATAYAAARLSLLADVVAYNTRARAPVDDVVLALRRALEPDRFGFLAHALATRDGCTSQNCPPLALLRDGSHVRSNLSGQTLDRYLEHYLPIWAKAAEAVVADAAQPAQPAPPLPSTTAQSAAANGRKSMVNIDFPTAASIPAVSIMNPEPSGPVLPGVAAAAATNPNPQAPASSRRPHKQATSPSPPAAQTVAATPGPPVEPIWPEPVPPPPPAASTPPAAPPAAAAPTQLNPYPPLPEASAGAAVRAQ